MGKFWFYDYKIVVYDYKILGLRL